MKNGEIVYEQGYGMADLDHGVRITPATVFDVASIAKQVTGAAILMLAQEGKLSLDDPVRKYLPDLPDLDAPITLREMLAQTSGLRDYEQLLRFDGWRLDSPDQITEEDIHYIVTRQKELNFSPGSDYIYSNTNYVLLAEIVRRVSGQAFPEFAMTRFFEPLGMKHTHFRSDHGEIVENLAYSYLDESGATQTAAPNDDTVGATNLMTTVTDLLRWQENMDSDRVGGAKIVEELQRPGSLNDGTKLNYAPGMFVGTTPGGLRWAESGIAGDAGYRADTFRLPDRHLIAITLCNGGSINPMDLNSHIVDLYLDGELSRSMSSGTPAWTFIPDPSRLSVYSGIFADTNYNNVLKLEQRGSSLWAESYAGPSSIGPAHLEAISEGVFRGAGLNKITFVSDGRSVTVERDNMRKLTLVHIAAENPTPSALHEFEGKYTSNELDIPYYVSIKNRGLVVNALKLGDEPLEPLANDLFIADDRTIHFTRDDQGKVAGLEMNGRWNRVQNLKFQRTTSPK